MPGKETGMKKTDYNLTLPEVSICVEENRQKRCKQEPKCQHVNCLRNALEYLLNEVVAYDSPTRRWSMAKYRAS